MNKLKLDIQFFSDCFTLTDESNELEIYVKQLKREVEALNNSTEEALTRHDGKIAELCNYIETNLENSLRCLVDSMIASGELDSLIKDLLSVSKLSVCTNVGEMQRSYNSEGTLVKTMGYHTINDGGGAYYYIRGLKTDDQFDDGSTIMLSNSLVAELLLGNVVNVKQFGACGDNKTDDTKAFKNANNYIIRKARAIDMGSQTIHSVKAVLEIPNGVYKVKGSNIFGSIETEANGNEKTIGYKLIGNNSTILWDVENKDDNLFFFDNTITSPVVEDLEILTTNSIASSKQYLGNVFRITAPQIAGQNYGNSSGGLYNNLRIVGFRNSKFNTIAPLTIFNIDGNAMCDQSHVTNCSFIEFGKVFISTNSQAVNWVFDRCSFNTSQEKAIYFDLEKCNDNFVVQNSSISLKASHTFLKAICKVNNSNKITERGDYNFILKDNRIEIIAGITGNSYYPIYINYGHAVIENSNFMLGGYSQSANPIFYLESHGSLKLRNCNLSKPTLIIPCVDDSISGLGNFINTSLVVEDCTHNGYTLKVNSNGTLYGYSRVITDRFKPLRKAIFKNFNKLANFRSENFEIIANTFGASSDKYSLTYSNTSGVAFGEEILLPPHQAVTKVTLHTRGTLPSDVKKIRVYFGEVSNGKYKDVTIDPTIVNSSKVIFDGIGAVITDDVSKQFIKVYPVTSTGEVESYQIISSIDVEYTALSPYSQFYKSTSGDVTYVL